MNIINEDDLETIKSILEAEIESDEDYEKLSLIPDFDLEEEPEEN